MKRAYAKVNIFLKITGSRGDYHEIFSRFMLVKELFDEISFKPKNASNDEFIIKGDFDCEVHQNTIYKAYLLLKNHKNVSEFFKTHYVDVKKNIPSFAGLGGGSSDGATFLLMCNDRFELGYSLDELATLGAKIGADVPFFVYGYESANVSGIGEIVQKFDEVLLSFDIVTPKIAISTPKVYGSYRKNFYNPLKDIKKFQNLSSKEILSSFSAKEVNDLLAPALREYDELCEIDGYFFSGSGSSFFRIKP